MTFSTIQYANREGCGPCKSTFINFLTLQSCLTFFSHDFILTCQSYIYLVIYQYLTYLMERPSVTLSGKSFLSMINNNQFNSFCFFTSFSLFSEKFSEACVEVTQQLYQFRFLTCLCKSLHSHECIFSCPEYSSDFTKECGRVPYSLDFAELMIESNFIQFNHVHQPILIDSSQESYF